MISGSVQLKKSAFPYVLFFCCTLCHSAEIELPDRFLNNLSSETFKERENAQKGLLAWAIENGPNAASAIYQFRKVSDDPEIRKRSYEILRELSDIDYFSDGDGYLGIYMVEEIVEIPGDDRPRFCVRVTAVVDDSPAKEAGIQNGDLITALDGKKWYDEGAVDDLMKKIADSKPFQEVILTISRRNEDSLEIRVRLGKRPVEDLGGIRGNIQELEKRAKDEHFRTWLKQLEPKD